jgi:hypothetical protein
MLAAGAVIAVLIGVVVFALANGGPSKGSVTGTVALTAEYPATSPKLVAAQVVLTHKKTSKTINVGPSGRFHVSLPPGNWEAVAQATWNNWSSSVGWGCEVVVTTGQISKLTIELDVTNINNSSCPL